MFPTDSPSPPQKPLCPASYRTTPLHLPKKRRTEGFTGHISAVRGSNNIDEVGFPLSGHTL